MQTQKSLERIFYYQDRSIRTVIKAGDPWFVALDVCEALEISNAGDATSRIDLDDIGLIDGVDSRGRRRTMKVISEAGLYTLVLGSRKPEAKAFKYWVTHEVLPALRQSGAYQVPTVGPSGQLVRFSRRDLLNLAMEAENECEELRGVVTDMLPKAEFYDRVADTDASFSLGETAKMLEIPGFGRNNLIRFLRLQGVLMADNVAKQRYIERGYFHVVQRDYCAPDGTLRVKAVTRVYEKGVDYIRHLLEDGEYLTDFRRQRDNGHSRSASERSSGRIPADKCLSHTAAMIDLCPKRSEGRIQERMERRNAGY